MNLNLQIAEAKGHTGGNTIITIIGGMITTFLLSATSAQLRVWHGLKSLITDIGDDMIDKRKVVVYEYQKAKGQTYYEKVSVGNGLFHQFGTDYEQFENGAASYSTAIVEMPDGSVKSVPVELIVFNN